jgi:hypothetical protein
MSARALHERLFKATITMQGETRVPIAIGRGGQSEMLHVFDFLTLAQHTKILWNKVKMYFHLFSKTHSFSFLLGNYFTSMTVAISTPLSPVVVVIAFLLTFSVLRVP